MACVLALLLVSVLVPLSLLRLELEDASCQSSAARFAELELPGTLKARVLDEPPGALLMDLNAFLQHVAAGLHPWTSPRSRTIPHLS